MARTWYSGDDGAEGRNARISLKREPIGIMHGLAPVNARGESVRRIHLQVSTQVARTGVDWQRLAMGKGGKSQPMKKRARGLQTLPSM